MQLAKKRDDLTDLHLCTGDATVKHKYVYDSIQCWPQP